MLRLPFALVLLLCVNVQLSSGKMSSHLSVQGTKMMLNGKQVFLSGVNQPWIYFGRDFGGDSAKNGEGYGEWCKLRQYLANITKAGGNSIRFWMFCDGENIPVFNSSGYVVQTDKTNSLISDVRRYVESARDHNMLVFFSLWNGAVATPQQLADMVKSEAKTQSFIDVVLTPLVKALAGNPALGGWEIFNEPEGSVIPNEENADPCWDTRPLKNTGAGWAGHTYHMQELQRFHNHLASAIHAADPNALVTTGTWSSHSLTNAFQPYDGQGYRAYWTDECLLKTGGRQKGTLDFYEVHSYASSQGYQIHAPFKESFDNYKLHKPLIVGEFDHQHSGMDSAQQYTYVSKHGYSGAWGWDAIGGKNVDNLKTLSTGLEALRNDPRTHINIGGHPTTNCTCSNVPPPAEEIPVVELRGYSCDQQASWGKCTQSWMKGHCCLSCFDCKGCH
eukprot:TRINITY_DN66780_c4_g1_i1.p1 TRINITY_DN66780_c4_g1~~TRINITY_DN66780_c4_g1_i1.p1  ORF type:complete len:446 (+),score=53.93 TRINITY_DN66780_c4_g1_i1:27-1364(+)